MYGSVPVVPISKKLESVSVSVPVFQSITFPFFLRNVNSKNNPFSVPFPSLFFPYPSRSRTYMSDFITFYVSVSCRRNQLSNLPKLYHISKQIRRIQPPQPSPPAPPPSDLKIPKKLCGLFMINIFNISQILRLLPFLAIFS